MRTRIVEATQDMRHGFNWGKFLIASPDWEWSYKSEIDRGAPLLRSGCAWRHPELVWVMDWQTKEGAAFVPRGYARDDLNRHRIHVCILFEPFLEWLYAWVAEHDGLALDELPAVVELPGVPQDHAGYRRPGLGPDYSGVLRCIDGAPPPLPVLV